MPSPPAPSCTKDPQPPRLRVQSSGAARTVRHPFIVRTQGILDCSSNLGIPVNLGCLGRLCVGCVRTFGFGFRPSVGFRVRNLSIGELSGSGFVHRRIPGSGFVHSKAKTSSGCPKPEPSFPERMKLEPMLAWPAKARTLDAADSENGTLKGSGAGEAGLRTLGSLDRLRRAACLSLPPLSTHYPYMRAGPPTPRRSLCASVCTKVLMSFQHCLASALSSRSL